MQRKLQTDRKSTTSSHNRHTSNKKQTNPTSDEYEEQEGKFLSTNQSKNNLNLLNTFRLSKKQMSVSPRRGNALQFDEGSDRADSIGPSNGSTKRDESISRYECIASITQQQNKNLKEQNQYLLQKLRKMQERQNKVRKLYQKAKKYKMLWEQAKTEIQVLKDQCQIYKDQADQMKKIILNDVCKLKKKVMETQINKQNIDCQEQQGQGQDQQYQIQSKKSQINSQSSTQHKSTRVSSTSSLTKYTVRCPEII